MGECGPVAEPSSLPVTELLLAWGRSDESAFQQLIPLVQAIGPNPEEGRGTSYVARTPSTLCRNFADALASGLERPAEVDRVHVDVMRVRAAYDPEK